MDVCETPTAAALRCCEEANQTMGSASGKKALFVNATHNLSP
jgi:hypothetical protein